MEREARGAKEEEPGTPASPESPGAKQPPRARIVDLSNSRHGVVKKAARAVGWEVFAVKDKDAFIPREALPNVVWTDTSVSVERVSKLSSMGAAVNHFPSMDAICRKVPLAMNLNRVQKRLPEEYSGIIPRTFLSFQDFRTYKQQALQESARCMNAASRRRQQPEPAKPFFIVKPNSGCMGKGIYLTSNPTPEAFHDAVVQEYLASPLLIEGRKFDIRCYVLVLSVCPPRLFFYNNGLVRICSEPYVPVDERNAKAKYMHLSNYSVNKSHTGYSVGDGQTGGKRDFPFLTGWLAAQGHDAGKFWDSVHDLAAKTVLAVVPTLAMAYRTSTAQTKGDSGFTCFEILGFDVLVNDQLEPVLCEVNHSPSWATETPFDATLKLAVISEAMKLATVPKPTCLLHPHHKQDKSDDALASHLGLKGLKPKALAKRERQEAAVSENWVRVYPAPDPDVHQTYKRILADGVAQVLDAGGRRVSMMTPAPQPRTGGYSRDPPPGNAPTSAKRRSQTTPATAVRPPRTKDADKTAAATEKKVKKKKKEAPAEVDAPATPVSPPSKDVVAGAGKSRSSSARPVRRKRSPHLTHLAAAAAIDAPLLESAPEAAPAPQPPPRPTGPAVRRSGGRGAGEGSPKHAPRRGGPTPSPSAPPQQPPVSKPVKRLRGGSPIPVGAGGGTPAAAGLRRAVGEPSPASRPPSVPDSVDVEFARLFNGGVPLPSSGTARHREAAPGSTKPPQVTSDLRGRRERAVKCAPMTFRTDDLVDSDDEVRAVVGRGAAVPRAAHPDTILRFPYRSSSGARAEAPAATAAAVADAESSVAGRVQHSSLSAAARVYGVAVGKPATSKRVPQLVNLRE
eukprot:TRINITY_DN5181_c0_g1_i1.p1 TRINITY_DN5181_c0_g1~~TRINITY_DN5181_c0_g1_i1.p1  ORF type:complete len:856 (+),score=285.79 TRINITY_DN5181_c0_g1_i1:22-2568(+)